MRKLFHSISSAALIAALPAVISAEPVTVLSVDRSVQLQGDLVSFDEETLVLRTQFGELALDRAMVTCVGADCPVEAFDLDATFALADDQSSTLVRSLVEGFAASKSMLALARANDNGDIARVVLMRNGQAEQVGSIDFAVSSLEDSFEALRKGEVNFMVSPVPMPEAIAARFVADGLYDPRAQGNATVVALDALVPVVHPSNSVRALSLTDIAEVLSGRVQNWSQLGGEDRPIRVILPEVGTLYDQVLTEVLYQPAGINVSAQTQRMSSQAETIAAVYDDPNAMTLSSIGAKGDTRTLPLRQSCGPLAYATDFSLKAEEYPLQGRLFLYKDEANLTASEREFVEYLGSDEAQSLISENGFIGQNVVAESISLQGTRLTSAITSAENTAELRLVQSFSDELVTADRLSTTFRFESGSARLDSKSIEDLERMVDFLNSDAAIDRDITLIGFSDSVGRFDLNERLSFLRASGLRTALLETPGGAELEDRISVSSYGPLAPVACNDSDEGREGNRRVEVWLR